MNDERLARTIIGCITGAITGSWAGLYMIAANVPNANYFAVALVLTLEGYFLSQWALHMEEE